MRDELRSQLILNEGAAVSTSELASFVQNLRAPSIRYEMLEGRRHMVVPMVMLLEGVFAGSGGAVLYTGEELGKTPEAWNAKPVVVYHPTINGVGVSACHPDILSRQKIGVILNARYEGGKLHAEAWLEEDRVRTVDNRVMVALQSKKMLEVSTGLFTDNEGPEGVWQGKPYHAVVRNFRPDHLAILPDKKGACSLADGAGLLRNDKKDVCGTCKQPLNKENAMDKEKFIQELITNSAWTEDDKPFLMGLEEDKLEKMKIEPPKKEPEPKAPVVNEPPKPPKASDPKPDPKVEPEKVVDPITLDSYINNAPKEIQGMLVSGINAHNKQKADLVTEILLNEAKPFTPEQLAAKSMEELQGIADLIRSVKPESEDSPLINYFGVQGGRPATPAADLEPLPLPSFAVKK